jgi:hypothetical protein
MALNVPGAPALVVAALERLKVDLENAAGANLAGLVLYGGLARRRYRPGKSDVNVVVALHDAGPEALKAVAPALQAAARAVAVVPMIVSPAEIARVAEAFPTKVLDIKNHHVLLAGADPFRDVEVSRERIRGRAAQELNNLLLRLRNRLVAASGDSPLLARTLADFARPFALELESLLLLARKPVPADDRSAIVFAAAATAFGEEFKPLARLAELRHDLWSVDDFDRLYAETLKAAARAVALAEEMKETD